MKNKLSVLFTIIFTLVFSREFLTSKTFASTAPDSFVDVTVTHPNFQAINYFRQRGILKGYQKNNQNIFGSTNKISRAEALKIILLGANISIEKNFAKKCFPDIEDNNWAINYICTANKKEFISGFLDGNFYPTAQVTRAEFLKIVTLAFDAPIENNTEVTDKFIQNNNENEEEWFTPYFDFAKKYRALFSDNISPHEAITRGEAVEILYRYKVLSAKNFANFYTFTGNGKASYYHENFAGKTTANGEIYDPEELTAAHRTLPFGTRIKVWYEDKFIIVRINDRGPYHEDRVLDLSSRAFANLAPLSRGVIEVKFEVILDNEEQAIVPTEILERTSVNPKNKIVPSEIQEKMREYADKIYREKKFNLPLFNKQITANSTAFFDDIELRQPISNEIPQGSTLNISGSVNEYGHKTVTVFYFPTDDPDREQKHFTTNLSGKNFSVPVSFLDAGDYQLGIVIDKNKQSRMLELTVKPLTQERKFASSSHTFDTSFEVFSMPEEEKLKISFNNLKPQNVAKLILKQRDRTRILYFEGEIREIFIDYIYFNNFIYDEPLALDLFVAYSPDGTIANRESNWKKTQYINYFITDGFPDYEKTEKIRVENYSRFLHSSKNLKISGEILDKNLQVADNAYLRFDNNEISLLPITKTGQTFSFDATIKRVGTYVLEIVGENGEVLFNRGIYYHPEQILPIRPWENLATSAEKLSEILLWINNLRLNSQLPAVKQSALLNNIAKKYAEKMNKENFLAHVAPDGETLADRVRNENLFGSFGENLAVGSTTVLALHALENSNSHLDTILTRKWNYVGIGISKNITDKKNYVVLLFGDKLK